MTSVPYNRPVQVITMSFLRSFLTFFLPERSAPGAEPPPVEVDVGEELQKVQRSLRRLSMASDRSAETLEHVSTRLDVMQQRLLQLSRPASAGVPLAEQELLRVLDQLERAASLLAAGAALEPLAAARDALLGAAHWQPVAVTGAPPVGTAIRVAEVAATVEGVSVGSVDEMRIARVLEQGYRRADGSLLRPAVIIAAPAGSCPTFS